MKAVIQRVAHASVIVDKQVIGAIDQGFLVLLGVGTERYKRGCRSDRKEDGRTPDLRGCGREDESFPEGCWRIGSCDLTIYALRRLPQG